LPQRFHIDSGIDEFEIDILQLDIVSGLQHVRSRMRVQVLNRRERFCGFEFCVYRRQLGKLVASAEHQSRSNAKCELSAAPTRSGIHVKTRVNIATANFYSNRQDETNTGQMLAN
jgi:hypothetical protein